MQTPQRKFFQWHYIVHRTGDATYYDPSYGITTTGPEHFTTNAIAGWSKQIEGLWHWAKAREVPEVLPTFTDQDW
jgi:hypothetical protein